jgi:hypothetical protein
MCAIGLCIKRATVSRSQARRGPRRPPRFACRRVSHAGARPTGSARIVPWRLTRLFRSCGMRGSWQRVLRAAERKAGAQSWHFNFNTVRFGTVCHLVTHGVSSISMNLTQACHKRSRTGTPKLCYAEEVPYPLHGFHGHVRCDIARMAYAGAGCTGACQTRSN